ncbi:MAG: hypothetical protein JJ892_07730 [Balneola sp.]|nr:hypothetical protein [Balneola sp.]MBO6651635.1 hypothetical protein [Balneola sp.]MBO6711958.1 hypothetical protein [Balneola sp.]MBO6800154.1 hypothetical protein [Balneola sp.]MBO6871658.1 hypothetical protein [Balneola sp.]
MKKYTFLLIAVFTICSSVVAQPNTEVFVFDLKETDSGFNLSNPVNVSENEGYDNQPSFVVDGSGIFYSSTRNGQTDIALYSFETGESQFLNNTPALSEYSPVQTPDKSGISFIILSEDGTQQFWKVTPTQNEPKILESEVVIGYYTWYTNDIYFCFVLADDDNPATFQQHTISTDDKKVLGTNPGRSLHKIPGKDAISFIDKNTSEWEIKAYYPESKSFETLANTLPEVEDMVWISETVMVMGSGSKLYFFDTKNSANSWELLYDLSEFELNGITRLAYHNGKLAVVVAGK